MSNWDKEEKRILGSGFSGAGGKSTKGRPVVGKGKSVKRLLNVKRNKRVKPVKKTIGLGGSVDDLMGKPEKGFL